jgi:cytochrome c oxidase subunit 3
MTSTNTPKFKLKKEQYDVAPVSFNTAIFIIASCMLFAALISAYLVHQPDGLAKQTWTVFELPMAFMASTIIAVLSSATIYLAYRFAKRDELKKNKLFLILSLALGLAFCISQFMGWQALTAMNLTFVNPRPADISASYIYVITALHLIHVFGGIVLLTVTLVRSFQFKVHKKQITLMQVSHTYWHFVGILWFMLYLFIYFAQ